MEEKKLLLSISISDGSNYTSVTLNIHWFYFDLHERRSSFEMDEEEKLESQYTMKGYEGKFSIDGPK
jgi:hypothetical protein